MPTYCRPILHGDFVAQTLKLLRLGPADFLHPTGLTGQRPEVKIGPIISRKRLRDEPRCVLWVNIEFCASRHRHGWGLSSGTVCAVMVWILVELGRMYLLP